MFINITIFFLNLHMLISTERLYAAILIVLLLTVIIKEIYFNDDDDKNNDKCSIKNIKDEIVEIIKNKNKTIYTKLIKSCQNGIIKGCITGVISGGMSGGIAGGALYGMASPIMTYVDEYKMSRKQLKKTNTKKNT
jgi:hypothetical protein